MLRFFTSKSSKKDDKFKFLLKFQNAIQNINTSQESLTQYINKGLGHKTITLENMYEIIKQLCLEHIKPQKGIIYITFLHWCMNEIQNEIDANIIEDFLSDININLQKQKCSLNSMTKPLVDSTNKNLIIKSKVLMELQNGNSKKNDNILMKKIIKTYTNYILHLSILQPLYYRIKIPYYKLKSNQIRNVITSLILIAELGKQIQSFAIYYSKQYINYIKIMLQCISCDITIVYDKLIIYVREQLQLINDYVYENFDEQDSLNNFQKQATPQIKQKIIVFAGRLEEIDYLNDALVNFYRSKYYKNRIKYIEEPNWITPSKNRFQIVFQLQNLLKQKSRKYNKKFARVNNFLNNTISAFNQTLNESVGSWNNKTSFYST